MMNALEKQVQHVGVRFYRRGSVDLALVPLMEESARYTRMAGDGYYLVVLLGEPGSAYPLDLRLLSALEPSYLEQKFHLDRRGYGYSPEELSWALEAVVEDLRAEERMDR